MYITSHPTEGKGVLPLRERDESGHPFQIGDLDLDGYRPAEEGEQDPDALLARRRPLQGSPQAGERPGGGARGGPRRGGVGAPRRLERVDAKILGAVLNKVSAREAAALSS